MFGIGLPELFIVLVIALVVLGPEKLPTLARAIGRGLGEFRKATDELKHSFNEDEELSALKNSLTQARDEMSGFVRESAKNISTEDLTKSLADGTFFDEKSSDDDQGKDNAQETASDDNASTDEKSAESTEPRAESSDTASGDQAHESDVVEDEVKNSDTPSDTAPDSGPDKK